MTGRDLTKGPVFGAMTIYALPILLGSMLQQAYNVVDTWVVGRYAGANALAGVGSAYTLMVFLTSILLGLCMGSGTVFSLCFGKRDEWALQETIGASFLLIGAVTLLLTILPLMLLPSILSWLRIPEEILALTHDYLRIVFIGIPAVFVYNYFAAYLKAVGDSVRPLVMLCISTVLNILLDLWFVAELHLGAQGAALATVIAQYLAGLGMAVLVMRMDTRVRQALRHLTVRKETVRQIADFSILTCLQQSVMNLGILMVQGRVNSFGTTVMAAFAAGVKIDSFAYMPAQEFANAFSTFTAQNVGAGKRERVLTGIKTAAAASLSYCAMISLVLWFLAKPLLTVFIDPARTEILAEGVRYLHIEGVFYVGIGCLFLLYGLYRAIGRPEMSLVLTIISLGTRVLLAYTISGIPAVGVSGIWWAIPIGWGLADATGIVYFLLRRDKLLGKIQ